MLTNEDLDKLVEAAEAEATNSDGHIDRDLHRKAVTRDVAKAIEKLMENDKAAVAEFIARYARTSAWTRVDALRRRKKIRVTPQQRLFYEPDAVLTVEENTDIRAADSTSPDWVKAAAIHQRNAKTQQEYALAYSEVAVAFQKVPPRTRLADAPVVLAEFTTEPPAARLADPEDGDA